MNVGFGWKAVIRSNRLNDAASLRMANTIKRKLTTRMAPTLSPTLPRLDDNKIHIRVEGLALPKSVESRNLSFTRTGIRWMSDKTRCAFAEGLIPKQDAP
jgi:hypothetical protein